MAAPTDTKLRSLKPRPTVFRVADMLGLCIEVRPTGSRTWRLRYRFGGPCLQWERSRRRQATGQGVRSSVC
ncbi:Arm DNA-binding domain-containing protein [Luteibacter sp. OK325]|uniref:Arm DNA-binding domain-containing protein n=1 Tax=Luteibacter sp. OK325 TaxID=2135670 RepID=UPI0031B5F0FB